MSLTDSDLDLSRRLDWRFLLPTAELARVACVGAADDRLQRALARFALDLTEAGSTEPSSADVVVVVAPTRQRLADAVRLLRPGGWLYAETTGRLRRTVVAELGRQGLEGARTSWHWPAFDPCHEIVPLDEPEAVRLSLARRRARATSRLKATVARCLLALGALDRVVPCASVVARRPNGEGPSAGFAGAFVANGSARLPPSGIAAALLVTPGFETSRNVIALLVPGGGRAPSLVAKTPRLAGDRDALAAEATALQELEALRPGLTSVPRVVAFEDVHGRPLLLETALAGTPMNPRAVAADPEGCIAAGLAWLAELPVTVEAADDAAFERLLEAPLTRFAATAPAAGTLVEGTLAVVEPLRHARLSLVFEHGDLGHPNLVLQPDGRLGVIDWELAERTGLPLADLCFFLAYVASARARAGSLSEHVAAFEEAFFAPGAWARRLVDAAAARAGIAPPLVDPLLVATWARYVLRLPERSGASAAAVSQTRQYAYWERSVAHLRARAGAGP